MAVGSWQLAVGSWQLAVGSWQLAVGSWQSSVVSRQSAVGSRQLHVILSEAKNLCSCFVPELRRFFASLRMTVRGKVACLLTSDS